MAHSFFSIIIPLYNKEKVIGQTLASVLAQGIQDFEVIVVDDGSTDGSAEVVHSITDSRIRYIKQENGGVSSARNHGIREARGEWILFLDADDEFLSGTLEAYNRMICRYPRASVLVGNVRILQKGKDITPVHRVREGETVCPYLSEWLGYYNAGSGNMAVRREIVERYGVMDERMSFFEDWEWGWRMLQCGRVAYTSDFVRVYHQEKGGDGLSQLRPPIEKEMVYYIPELPVTGFWSKALLYEILVMELSWGRHPEEFGRIKEQYFNGLYSLAHWIRQKCIVSRSST